MYTNNTEADQVLKLALHVLYKISQDPSQPNYLPTILKKLDDPRLYPDAGIPGFDIDSDENIINKDLQDILCYAPSTPNPISMSNDDGPFFPPHLTFTNTKVKGLYNALLLSKDPDYIKDSTFGFHITLLPLDDSYTLEINGDITFLQKCCVPKSDETRECSDKKFDSTTKGQFNVKIIKCNLYAEAEITNENNQIKIHFTIIRVNVDSYDSKNFILSCSNLNSDTKTFDEGDVHLFNAAFTRASSTKKALIENINKWFKDHDNVRNKISEFITIKANSAIKDQI